MKEDGRGIRRVFKGSVGFSTLMPSPQIVMRESSSQMHSGHRVEPLSRGAREVTGEVGIKQSEKWGIEDWGALGSVDEEEMR